VIVHLAAPCRCVPVTSNVRSQDTRMRSAFRNHSSQSGRTAGLPFWRLRAILFASLLANGCQDGPHTAGAAGANPPRASSATETQAPRGLILTAPNTADPAQEALIRWHRALVEADFDAYSEVDFHAVGESVKARRWFFDAIRPGVPPVIQVSEGTDSVARSLIAAGMPPDPIGMRTFMIVGCVSRLGGANAVRKNAVVTVRKLDGKWKVGGASFGPTNEYTNGPCPLQVGSRPP
jgi:hypothetical protein